MTLNDSRDIDLVNNLLATGRETEWLEFKHNQGDGKVIGKLCSALSNGARIHGKEKGYCLWGIDDKTCKVVGTKFDPYTKKCGGQNFQLWLESNLKPDSLSIGFREIHHPEGRVVLMEVSGAISTPTSFQDTPYIRIGDATPKLSDHYDLFAKLVQTLGSFEWEKGIAKTGLQDAEVLQLLDYEKYFKLINSQISNDLNEVLTHLKTDRLIEYDDSRRWNITNLGAILFAKDLNDFDSSLVRKGIRLIVYRGKDRASLVVYRQDETSGYAVGFETLISILNKFIPVNEHIGAVLREEVPLFPPIAVRELIINALIHQDFTITGAGPMIELFKDRMEITNPGCPLIEVDRMIDLPPRSRNEALAGLMRRMGFCEERGSGIDKVIEHIELFQIPAPLFRASEHAMRVILYGSRTFSQMTTEQCIHACYYHAAIKHLAGDKMTNSSLRQRLGFSGENIKLERVQTSKIIRQALDKRWIAHIDLQHKKSGYAPAWATR